MKLDIKSALGSAKTITACVWIFRVFVGMVFIFSGWAKAVDLWGTVYKIEEYFNIWGLNVTRESVVALSFVLAATEFCSGVMLIVGCFRRVVTWILMAFMVVMTPLTLYIYVANPVADCGCFGDALIISNGATFFKNLVLTALIAYLMVYNKRCRSLYNYRIQWLTVVAASLYVFVIGFIGYNVQPLVDFRPYAVGQSLASAEDSAASAGIVLVYEKDGQRQEFAVDNLPDDSWTYVGRRTVDSAAGGELTIFDGDEDVTADVIATEGPQLILTVLDAPRYGISRSLMANSLNAYVEKLGGSMFAVVAGDGEIASRWAETVDADYAVYSADDTELKALARGDAALIYLEDGIVKWKRNIYSFSPHFPSDADSHSANVLADIEPIESPWNVINLTIALIVVMFLISTLNIIPAAIKRSRQKKSDVPAEEATSVTDAEN
jgi:uncharacterized membrane protein YphA (DoxX/SURF4 family)